MCWAQARRAWAQTGRDGASQAMLAKLGEQGGTTGALGPSQGGQGRKQAAQDRIPGVLGRSTEE